MPSIADQFKRTNKNQHLLLGHASAELRRWGIRDL
jgi:hypothetical protein